MNYFRFASLLGQRFNVGGVALEFFFDHIEIEKSPLVLSELDPFVCEFLLQLHCSVSHSFYIFHHVYSVWRGLDLLLDLAEVLSSRERALSQHRLVLLRVNPTLLEDRFSSATFGA